MTETHRTFVDVDRMNLTPGVGDLVRVGCPHCPWRSDPIEVAATHPNPAWIAFQSIDYLFRDHLVEEHPQRPLRLVARPVDDGGPGA